MLNFLQRFPTKNELKGSFGEWLVKIFTNVTTDTLILHDVLIDGADGHTSQIDLLMIGACGIYVVEVKMYENAKIYGDGNKSTWYYYLDGKKYEIYSPMKQNKKHIEYLKAFLKDFGDIPYFSIITVICEDIKIVNVNEDQNNKDTCICTSLPIMLKGLKVLSDGKPAVLDEEQRRKIFDYIQANQHDGKVARKQHKQSVIDYKANLDEMKKQKICPYCKEELVLRNGKYGEFYGCRNYPKCKYVLNT